LFGNAKTAFLFALIAFLALVIVELLFTTMAATALAVVVAATAALVLTSSRALIVAVAARIVNRTIVHVAVVVVETGTAAAFGNGCQQGVVGYHGRWYRVVVVVFVFGSLALLVVVVAAFVAHGR
jgi:hypothetical protein